MPFYPLFRPLIFSLDAERAHGLTLTGLKLLPAISGPVRDARLAIRVAGLEFPNPVGLAAGFDKNGQVFRQMLELGFGFTEVGTVTPRPQSGNARPRLFRLEEDRAVINRMGFNNHGLEAAARRLAKRKRKGGIVGVNVGANKDSDDRVADYVAGVRAMAGLADYLTINISSPNTPGLRGLQEKEALQELLGALRDVRVVGGPPLFLKVAPDLDAQAIDDIAASSMQSGIDALIVANTTLSRPDLRSPHGSEAGGLSGAPLKQLALQRIRDFRRATGGAMPLIAAGGIENGVDAYARIRAGASLVQLYSALVYQGPGLARMITSELKNLMLRDGFTRLSDAVGSENL